MATISDLIGLLFPILNLHVDTLARHASQLRVAGYLPDEDADLTASEVAAFLAVAAGARAPTEAVEAARVFAALPAIGEEDRFENPAIGTMSGTWRRLADMPPPPDPWAGPMRSFVAALEAFIHVAEDPRCKLEDLPIAIGIMRNLRDPHAILEIGRAEPDGTYRRVNLHFAPPDALTAPGSADSQRMVVWVYLPGVVIARLGDLLAGRRDAKDMMPSAEHVPTSPAAPAAPPAASPAERNSAKGD